MHKLLVLYPPQDDPAAFRAHYESVHLPLTARLPGMRSARYAYQPEPVEPGGPEFFALFEAEFDSADALAAALGSAEGQAVAADVPQFASNGAHVLHYTPASALGPDPREVVLRYLDAWARRDVDGILTLFADGGRYRDPSLPGEIGVSDLRKHLDALFTAIPDLTLRVLAAAADGPDTAVAYWRMTGTAIGQGAKANGGTYNLPGADILRIDNKGKITWTEALYDQKTFAEQGGSQIDLLGS